MFKYKSEHGDMERLSRPWDICTNTKMDMERLKEMKETRETV